MLIQLSPDVEQAIRQESEALGIDPAKLTAQVIATHASAWRARQTSTEDRASWTIDDYIAFLKSRNPDYETFDPHAIDWQAVKAEGRRY